MLDTEIELVSEDRTLLQPSSPQNPQLPTVPTRNVLQALFNEARILFKGLTNQEYLDYCFVKGACQQTIPLVLFLPVGLFLGCFNIIIRCIINISDGTGFWSNTTVSILQIIGLVAGLYLLLKACEVIPKMIKNPLLFGKVTTYVFMCLLIVEGILVVVIDDNNQERIAENVSRVYHTSQFWVVFALVVWQKVFFQYFLNFFQSNRCQFYSYMILESDVDVLHFFTYITLLEYQVRTLNGHMYFILNIQKNIIKATVYIALELVMSIDTELKNFAQYQLENNMQQTNSKLNGEQIQFMLPPITLFTQANILEAFSNTYPVAIFDQTKELLNISGIACKQLELDILIQDVVDLLEAERKLRKMEIIQVYNQKENNENKIKRLKKQAKFGSSCGTNERGELLHSLIDGPALQQLRSQQQVQDQPRLLNYNAEGILEELLNQILGGEEDVYKGLAKYQILKDVKQQTFDIKYFQFVLQKVDKGANKFNIILTLDDVTQIMNQSQQKVEKYNNTDQKKLCNIIRQQLQATGQSDIENEILNLETKMIFQDQETIHLQYQKVDFGKIEQTIIDNFSSRFKDIKLIVKNTVSMNTEFYNDQSKILQIIETSLKNSIKYTKDGLIQVTIQNDKRPGCVEVTVEDTGVGFNQEVFQQERLGNLMISNQLAKIIGPMSYSNDIKGMIANKGLRIVSRLEYGTKIQFSIRNFSNDQTTLFYLIDEDISQDESEVGQEDIMERYLREEESFQYLPRLKKAMKYIVLKQDLIKVSMDIKPQIAKKQTKLAGMMKLQESGRLKNLPKLLDGQPIPCACNSILLINSSVKFANYFSKLGLLENTQIVSEEDTFKTLNIKQKEKSCGSTCQLFKVILVNCSDLDTKYEEFISKLYQFNKNLKIVALSYTPYGQINQLTKYSILPSQSWIDLVQ